MPLIKSPSRPAVGRNIAEMEAAGHPRAQAIAAALNNARKYGAKFALGGDVTWSYQMGPDPGAVSTGIHKPGREKFAEGGAPHEGKSEAQRPLRLSDQALNRMAAQAKAGLWPPTIKPSVVVPGEARGGSIRFADGGPSWTARLGARGLAHSGFIHSAVPGRTDRLPISVKGGSYILPADHISALGEGNSLAGANIVNKMFGLQPAGGSPLGKGIGAGLHPIRPTAPKLGRLTGRKDGGETHTPIIAAGGEVSLPPENVVAGVRKMTGNPNIDLDQAHKILDAWVVNTRKKHIKTLRGLKPPKK